MIHGARTIALVVVIGLGGFGVVSVRAQKTADIPGLPKPEAAKEYNKGLEAVKKGDKTAAEANFRKAVKIDPTFALAHNNLGSLLQERGDLAGAEASYQLAVAAKPRLALALLNLAQVQFDQKKYAETDQTLDKLFAVVTAPAVKPADGNGTLTEILTAPQTPKGDGTEDEAFSDIQRAHANYVRGLTRAALGRPQEAVVDYRESIKYDAANAKAHHFLAMALLDLGDQNGAIAEFGEATRLDPKLAESFFNLGAVLYRVGGRNPEAIAAMETYLKLVPTSPQRPQVEAAIKQMKDEGAH